MVESKSKGSMSLDEKAMNEWEERIKEAERRQQERRRRASGNTSSAASSSP
jgi:hypothetical protein